VGKRAFFQSLGRLAQTNLLTCNHPLRPAIIRHKPGLSGVLWKNPYEGFTFVLPFSRSLGLLYGGFGFAAGMT
jgi:hypothetical protein